MDNTFLSRRIKRTFELTSDLFAELGDTHLTMKIPSLPSNSIRGQVWCIIGARESYSQAIESGGWQGFSCSLEKDDDIEKVRDILIMTKAKLLALLEVIELSSDQMDLLYDLYEHELQHHGQLIRYVYSNKLRFPKSWNDRYTV